MPASSAPIPEPAPLRVLPFHGDAFDWRRFETFCLDVVRALPDVRHAELYNVPGGNQRGIDIFATLDDGRDRTIQCRHRRRFTKGDAEKVLEETTYDADEHEVWVTARVGAAAAGVLDGHDGWSYQSDEGISQLVRSLPTEVARKILDWSSSSRSSAGDTVTRSITPRPVTSTGEESETSSPLPPRSTRLRRGRAGWDTATFETQS